MVKHWSMTMNIKSKAAHDLAKELAALEHTTVTNAVTMSLREALERRRAEVATEQRRTRIHEIADRFTEQIRTNPGPSLWTVTEDLYDERGLPR